MRGFAPEIILWCIRWYGTTPMSYANLSDMLQERGISVNRSTIYRWFIEFAPSLRKKVRRYQMIHADSSWQLDETYVKVKGKWFYLYRAINKQGQTLDFYFSHKRNRHSAYQFLKRCLRYYPLEKQPQTLNTDKHSSYGHAISRLKKEGRLRQDIQQRQVKHLNNSIESDHAPIKKLIVATGGFKCRKRAWSTIQGFESLRMLNKGQLDFWLRRDEPKTLARERSAFMNRLFNVEVIFN
ncbi:TPA: IS6 family transposase [Vibrio parahaemolyticus]|uniref:IS6 family transposase n=1 Tax=Vibrio parahaemolyticus TaxID=670 RepID=UPI0011237DB0|nr:IS6 family transposase [Vibrio parahaemolyticus]TOG38308.1 IS6 family transposase [Vibrio parahaemolyticus]HBN6206083.1 IS6 family transposase [Vibrio parahaemolyticus]HCH4062783.1 IS6 family transposase [Vibrio parahaemolyticus]